MSCMLSISDADAEALLESCLTTSKDSQQVKRKIQRHKENFSNYTSMHSLFKTGLAKHENDTQVPQDVLTEVQSLAQKLSKYGFTVEARIQVINKWADGKSTQ